MNQVKNEGIMIFRFGVIFPLLDESLCYGQRSRILEELAAKEYDIPGSERKMLSKATMYSWLRLYQEKGLEGLAPKTRSDKGGHRAISTESELALRQFREQHPQWKLTTLAKVAAQKGIFLPSERVSMSAVYRILKDYDKEKKARKSKDMRRFEMENCNDVWMLDAMVGPKVTITVDGKEMTVTAMLWAFIDDKSRLITHGEFYRNQKAESLLTCLWEALSKRGLPRKIFTDNGSAMKDNRLKLGCADLEISLSYARIYTPTSKAKIERFFSTVRMQFMPLIEDKTYTLRELNAQWFLWLKEYNSRYHSGIGATPMDCYMDNIKAVRPAPPDMSSYFRARLERKVSAARTIRFNNKYYQVPLGYANLTIEIRFFTPEGQIEAFYDGKSIGFIEEVDFIVNGNAHRQSREDQ